MEKVSCACYWGILMSDQEGKYNIKAVSKLLGIQSGTLRAWERRYKMIAPKRNESGHRLYSEEHIKILKWLLEKVNSGFTISQAVNLLEEYKETSYDKRMEETNPLDKLTDELLYSLVNFQRNKAEEQLNKLFSLYTVNKVVIEIFGTLIRDIANQRETRKITTAHEQFAYSILRIRIGVIIQNLPEITDLPRIITVCSPGEINDMDLLIFTYFFRSKGYEVIYLGVGVIEEDYNNVIEEVMPTFLFLTSNLLGNIKRTCNLIDQLSSGYKQLLIGLGGRVNSAIDLLPSKYNKYLIGVKEQQWEEWLKENLGQ